MALAPWRMTRTEVREILNKYEKAVEDDAYFLLQPSMAERALLGDQLLKIRATLVRQARDANKQFVDKVIEDLPDLCSGPDALTPPLQPVAEFRILSEDCPTLPASSYGSLASVFLHLLRDWSEDCAHVGTSTYDPAVAELQALLPQGGSVLVPGAGLGRLALNLAAKGYSVEANDASRLFLTFADYVLNRAPAASHTLFPMAHVFSENWSHEAGQYLKIQVPVPGPAEIGSSGTGALKQPIAFVAGDFTKTYGPGRPGQRHFDAIVTSFFIDTAVDVLELFNVMDGLLAEGGIWVNIGPLNWRKEARLKLSWDEIIIVWERLGYEFVTKKAAEVDYHLPHGLKMYTESYNCALTAAIKRGRPKEAA